MQENEPKTHYRTSLRERIIDVAMTAFTQHGIKAVKMDDIAKTLTISKRTLYEIYATKEVLLFEIIKYYHERRKKELESYMAEGHHVMEIIIFFYRRHSETYSKTNPLFYEDLVKYPMALHFLNEQKEKNHQNFFLFMKQGVEEGFFRNDVNYELIAHLFEAISAYLYGEHLYKRYTHEELFRNMLFVTLRGFCTEKGVQALDTLLG